MCECRAPHAAQQHRAAQGQRRGAAAQITQTLRHILLEIVTQNT